MNGLLIRNPWIDMILQGKKIWEIRGSNTKKRGKIALIASGTGMIVGTCEIVDSIGPLTIIDLKANTNKHRISERNLVKPPYRKTFAWVLNKAKKLENPIPYKHPRGAIIWVKLPENCVIK